jgi:hypothetical protein
LQDLLEECELGFDGHPVHDIGWNREQYLFAECRGCKSFLASRSVGIFKSEHHGLVKEKENEPLRIFIRDILAPMSADLAMQCSDEGRKVSGVNFAKLIVPCERAFFIGGVCGWNSWTLI